MAASPLSFWMWDEDGDSSSNPSKGREWELAMTILIALSVGWSGRSRIPYPIPREECGSCPWQSGP